jgi:hypothetical protein
LSARCVPMLCTCHATDAPITTSGECEQTCKVARVSTRSPQDTHAAHFFSGRLQAAMHQRLEARAGPGPGSAAGRRTAALENPLLHSGPPRSPGAPGSRAEKCNPPYRSDIAGAAPCRRSSTAVGHSLYWKLEWLFVMEPTRRADMPSECTFGFFSGGAGCLLPSLRSRLG